MRYHWKHFMFLLLIAWICGGESFLFRIDLPSNTASPLSADSLSDDHDTSKINDNTDSPPRRRGRIRPLRRGNQLSQRVQTLQQTSVEHRVRQEIAQQDPNLLVDQLFSDVVSAPTARALQEQIGVDRMTLVQGRTFALAKKGESLLVRARVGTGKTLAFLVPLVERLVSLDPTEFQPGKDVGILIVEPTVELARQTAQTATDLIALYPTLSTRLASGGSSIQSDLRSLQRRIPAILIATPGRLVDLAEDERIRGQKISDILGNTKMVVLDEADSLASSFKNDLTKILSHLPRKRQTMLFSATIPGRLKMLLPEMCMTTPWTHIDCIGEEKDGKLRVEETYTVLNGIEDYLPSVLFLVRELAKKNQHKAILFFPAVRMVKFFADVLRTSMPNLPVWEIHSQMSQSRRRRVADSFRTAKHGFLLTSDVSARGLDYPDVDTVIQYGLPSKRELYLHRIGRTGRAGGRGQAILVLMPFEKLEILGKRKDRLKESKSINFNGNSLVTVKQEYQSIHAKIASSQPPLVDSAEGCILAFLAYYAVHKPRTVLPSQVRAIGEEFAVSVGLSSIPQLSVSLDQSLQ